ncbi:hypothetical protein ACN47E_005741 [Coniothyrium glycines]
MHGRRSIVFVGPDANDETGLSTRRSRNAAALALLCLSDCHAATETFVPLLRSPESGSTSRFGFGLGLLGMPVTTAALQTLSFSHHDCCLALQGRAGDRFPLKILDAQIHQQSLLNTLVPASAALRFTRKFQSVAADE